MKTRRLTFASAMGVLGDGLSLLTLPVFPLAQQIALDFSSLPVLVAAVFGDPGTAALAGFIAGILPSVWFGFVGGALGFLGFSASVGKALHGFTVGFLARAFRPLDRRYGSISLIPLAVVGFIPEAVWIYFVFSFLTWVFTPTAAPYLSTAAVPIIVKATVEVAVIGFFLSALAGNEGFKSFIEQRFKT